MHLKENTETTDGRPDGQRYENADCRQRLIKPNLNVL